MQDVKNTEERDFGNGSIADMHWTRSNVRKEPLSRRVGRHADE